MNQELTIDHDSEISAGKTLKRANQRERLVQAMLEQPTIAKAADSIGISRATAWRIMQTPEFQDEFLQAREDAVLLGQARLQLGANAAAATLMKLMLDPIVPPATRLRAAQDVLDRGGRTLRNEINNPRGRGLTG
jgi:hypothetical protein